MDKIKLYSQFLKAARIDKVPFILDACKGRKVLDVGCLGQDFPIESENWLHGKIARCSDSVTGVDIIDREIEAARRKGHNILHKDKLSPSHKFDIIVMSDIIEHVDNPVELLTFYKKFLSKEGRIIITTPNAKRAYDFINILLSDRFWMNYEHTMWLCPLTMLEIIRRSGLRFDQFYWLNDYRTDPSASSYVRKIYFLSGLLAFRKSFSPNFMFVLKTADED
jgi:2-polyprenyl-3-methyl-5-hydroxy-6-metoxy-1,4-benzoquinol methylase